MYFYTIEPVYKLTFFNEHYDKRERERIQVDEKVTAFKFAKLHLHQMRVCDHQLSLYARSREREKRSIQKLQSISSVVLD